MTYQPFPAAEAAPTSPASEKPTNGIKGLKHWRHDLVAGLVVSLVSLPLSSGIAIASGAPPVYGLISAIIAGLVYPALGGSYVTISGPAAGLAPALVAIMASLGGVGDGHHVGAGYPRLLVVIMMVGLLQIVLAKLKLAKYAAIFPASVVEGMLAAIGVLIVVKSLPMLLGVVDPGHPHSFVEYVSSIPGWLRAGLLPAAGVGLTTLFVMVAAASPWARKLRLFRVVPPHLWGVAVAVPLGAALGLRAIDARLLIDVPANPLAGMQAPAWGEVFGDPSLWHAAIVGVITLLLIDGVESIATAQAIDRVDPYRRTSDPNRVILAMGVSNLLSGLLGGLTVIPGGVKSKTNIEAGGRTLWSNFVNAVMLLIFIFVAPGLISMIPTAALGGILVYTGVKMAHPAIAKHVSEIGSEQFALYAITLLTTLLTDLLVGVAVGTACKLLMLAYWARNESKVSTAAAGVWAVLLSMFLDPMVVERKQPGTAVLRVRASFVCFNAYRLRDHLGALGDDVQSIIIDVSDDAIVCDHTGCEALLGSNALVGTKALELRGLETMTPLSRHREAIRIRRRLPTRLQGVG